MAALLLCGLVLFIALDRFECQGKEGRNAHLVAFPARHRVTAHAQCRAELRLRKAKSVTALSQFRSRHTVSIYHLYNEPQCFNLTCLYGSYKLCH